MIKRFAGWMLLIAACLAGSVRAAEDVVPVNPDHPATYTVKPGDTLWGIAEKFLRNPWQWPAVWHVNEQVGNPHLIFPGDVLRLTWREGRPAVVVDNGPVESIDPDSGMTVVKLQPAIREMSLAEAIPAIPLHAIKSFLNESRVATANELSAAPYIVAGPDRRILMGQGDIAYGRDVLGHWNKSFPEYGVYRSGLAYIDPDTDELLGYEAMRVANVRVTDHQGEIATLRVRNSQGELRIDDRLLYDDQRVIQSVFNPRSAPEGVTGRIIHIFGSMGYAARNDVVVINKGVRDEVKPGHVFAVMQQGEMVRDRRQGDLAAIPATRAGLAIVFRSFEKVSYALVTNSSRPMSRGDQVRAPQGGL